MVTISLCMIVKNEEDTLARCLDTVHDLVDEINIVDTGSEDKTVEIAKEYTERVFHFPWTGNFAEARNESFSHATMDYIFYMDADDVLLEEDRDKLKSLKESLNPAIDSVSMYYNAGMDSFGNVTLRYRRHRLLRREKNYKWYGDCHNYLNVAGNIMNSDVAVTHKSPPNKKSRIGRNLSIYQTKIERGDGFSPRDYFYYGNELRESGRHQEAIESYEKNLAMKEGWVDDKIHACINMADCYRILKDDSKELTSLLRSLEYGVPRPETLCRIGYHFHRQKKWQIAAYWYEQAINMKPDFNQWSFSYPAYSTWYPHLQLCVCYYYMGNFQKAWEHNEEAGKYRPEDTSVLHNRKLLESKLNMTPTTTEA
ncbi:glycosyltransferase [Alicyclobacillus sp. SO9]|uniref:glycosyltransferase n=1 Tax=Alicyclobacillus sp. SO9 TaxID=2665646 RepID=UPI0018E72BA8|nr:glycosyltransferase [Alicyclobacillus sp. SO9]QQE80328.1 glycosyltransferase [Alicyclobacillus sp. SO9]